MSTVDVTELSPEQLIELIVAAKRALYPDARVVDGQLECSQCKEQGIPALVEDGMTVTHDLVTLVRQAPNDSNAGIFAELSAVDHVQ